ncbi:MAG: hypothetical protein IJ584_05280, partial [Bacteroidales bacterium]|nr:hypothetical protein [Bacteroidales bacterium]
TAGAIWLAKPHSADEYLVLFLFLKDTEYNWMCPRGSRAFMEDTKLAGLTNESVAECLSSFCSSGVMFKLRGAPMPFINPAYFWKGGIIEHHVAERLYDDIIRNPEKSKWRAYYKGAEMSFSLGNQK